MNTEAVAVLEAQRKVAVAYLAEQSAMEASFRTSCGHCTSEIARMNTRITAIDKAIKQLSKGN